METNTINQIQLFLTDKMIQKIFEDNHEVSYEDRFYNFISEVRHGIRRFLRHEDYDGYVEIIGETFERLSDKEDYYAMMASVISILLLLLNNSQHPNISQQLPALAADISLELVGVI